MDEGTGSFQGVRKILLIITFLDLKKSQPPYPIYLFEKYFFCRDVLPSENIIFWFSKAFL